MPGALTEGGSDVGMAAEPEQRHQTVSEGREILRCVATANLTGILLEGHNMSGTPQVAGAFGGIKRPNYFA